MKTPQSKIKRDAKRVSVRTDVLLITVAVITTIGVYFALT